MMSNNYPSYIYIAAEHEVVAFWLRWILLDRDHLALVEHGLAASFGVIECLEQYTRTALLAAERLRRLRNAAFENGVAK